MAHNKPTLIIVADASRVRAFTTEDRGATLHELPGGLDALPPAPAHHHGHGGPEKHHANIHARRPAMDPNADPHQKAEDKLAVDLANRLEGLVSDQAYAGLVIFAPPVFLGNLRRDLSGGLTKKIIHEAPKDLVKSSLEDIRKHVNEALFPAK